jgi:hypothetical protein
MRLGDAFEQAVLMIVSTAKRPRELLRRFRPRDCYARRID